MSLNRFFKHEDGLGLVEFLVASAVVAGSIAIFLQRAMQMDRQRRVDEFLHYKAMVHNNIRGLLSDRDICGTAFHPPVGTGTAPSVSFGSLTLQTGSHFGPMEITEMDLEGPDALGISKFKWTLRERSGLTTARTLQDSVQMRIVGSPMTSCELVGQAADPWLTTKAQMCAHWNRPLVTPSNPLTAIDIASMNDCTFSSFLIADFASPGGNPVKTRWSVESTGARIIAGDHAAAVRTLALDNLMTTPTLCPAGQAVVRIKDVGAGQLGYDCAAIPPAGGGGGGTCTSPCLGGASTQCCRDFLGSAEFYQDGVMQPGSPLPGTCAVNFSGVPACDSGNPGTGSGCSGQSFFCPAPCGPPSPCDDCCETIGSTHVLWTGGIAGAPIGGACTAAMGPSCGALQMGVGPGCTGPSFRCGPASCGPPSPCAACCLNIGVNSHRLYSGGVPTTGVVSGSCTAAMGPSCTMQAGVGSGCTGQQYACSSGCSSGTPLPSQCQPCLENVQELTGTSPHCTGTCGNYSGVGWAGLVSCIQINGCCTAGGKVWHATAGGTNGIPNYGATMSGSGISGSNWSVAACSQPQPFSSSSWNYLRCVNRTFTGICGTFRCL